MNYDDYDIRHEEPDLPTCEHCGEELAQEDNSFGYEGPSGPGFHKDVSNYCSNERCSESADFMGYEELANVLETSLDDIRKGVVDMLNEDKYEGLARACVKKTLWKVLSMVDKETTP